MARAVFYRLRRFARGGLHLIRDSFFARLCVAAALLWPPLRFPALLLIAILLGCLALAGYSAVGVYVVLRPATEWPIGPAIAAFLVFIVLLELLSASVTMSLRAALQLSFDIGRHRIGTLLTMLTLATVGITLLDAQQRAFGWAGISAAMAATLVLIAGSLWFERVYRRPAYPRFRDFHADVVQARAHLDRAAHGG